MTILDELRSEVTTEVRLFGHVADLSDPDNPAFEYRGRIYHVVECRPYVTKSGGDTKLLTLAADCETCGQQFEYDTGWKTLALYANCEQHRRNHSSKRARPSQPASQPISRSPDPEFARLLANATLSKSGKA